MYESLIERPTEE